jgi:sulfite exporter TauE/SafE
MNPLFLAFITGLTSGGVSCLAVQGGLLASAVSQKNNQLSNKTTVGMFLWAKVMAYTSLGFVLGLLGSKVSFSPTLQGWMQIFAGLYMLATAANLLKLHPIFRYTVIQPPKIIYKLLRNQSRTGELFAPGVLGAMTVLVPCGITQGMLVLALTSANPLTAAAIMFAFTLGTTPVFAILGMSASKFMEKKAFVYITSFIIFILGLVSLNTGQVLRGSAHTAQNYWRVLTTVPGEVKAGTVAGVTQDDKQEVVIDVKSSGYSPSDITLKVGVPVRLSLKTDNTQGCSRAFTIPALNIFKQLPQTGTEIIEFTPTQKGTLAFTCSMGMFTGRFQVI